MNLDKLSALDVETEPTIKTEKPYALEPWRVGQGKARISCFTIMGDRDPIVGICDDHGDTASQLDYWLSHFEGEHVVCHNALFDVGWIYATLKTVRHKDDAYDMVNKIKWLDSLLLSKWISNHNGHERVSHSLINVCNRHIPDHPRIEEFNDVKSQKVKAGDDFEYWLERNKLDTEMTLAVFKAMWAKLPESSRTAYLIEQSCIAPIAKGWIEGIPFDDKFAADLHIKIEKKKQSLCKELNIPVGCLTSPKQKQELIFTKWGILPGKLTPSGKPSTAVDVLMRIHQKTQDPRFDKLMAAIKLATVQSKYTNGFARTLEYVGEPVLYGNPKIFGTYTGRMTYSNKTTKKQEHQTSIALHQVPRKAKTIKHCMKAPPGKGIIAIDANSQEVRFVAIQANESVMIAAYNEGKDLHAVMTSSISGIPYDEVVSGNKEGVHEVVEYRQAGKLLNLSCSYRIGAPSLAEKFFTTYEKDIDLSTSHRYLSMYKKQYPGVVRYWSDAVSLARSKGYAETIGGRRCRIDKFDWSGESTAINFPVQGSGAEHKYATISMVNMFHPELTLMLDLHDGLYYACDLDKIEEVTKELIGMTYGPTYSILWDKDIPIELPFDGQFSTTSFAEFGSEL